MHEATIAGSERIGHSTSGGIAIGTSSRIEIMASGYQHDWPWIRRLRLAAGAGRRYLLPIVRGLVLINVADSHPLIVPRVRHYLTDALKVSDDQRLAWIQHWLRAVRVRVALPRWRWQPAWRRARSGEV
jgi:hypothetical protein